MIYKKCKCGKCESWSSGMPSHDCDGCNECKTTLASGPGGHKELQPHKFYEHEEIIRRDGKITKHIITKICEKCHHKEKVKK